MINIELHTSAPGFFIYMNKDIYACFVLSRIFDSIFCVIIITIKFCPSIMILAKYHDVTNIIWFLAKQIFIKISDFLLKIICATGLMYTKPNCFAMKLSVNRQPNFIACCVSAWAQLEAEINDPCWLFAACIQSMVGGVVYYFASTFISVE